MEEITTTDLFLSNKTTEPVDTQEILSLWCATPAYTWFLISAVFTGICVCGLVGNMMVVWFLGFRMKKNPFTVYVLNLAVADFSLLLFLLVILTLQIISKSSCVSIYNYFLSSYILIGLFLFWYFAGMYLLTAMSMERCLSVLFPIWYRCHRPKRLSGITCGVLWAVTGLLDSSALITCYSFGNTPCEKLLQGLSTVNFLAFSFFPLISNLCLFIRLRCGSQRRHPGKIYVVVLLSVIFMFTLGLPFSVVLFLEPDSSNLVYLHITYLPASLNSSINPLIYFLVGSCRHCRFQGSVKVAFQRVFEEKTMSEERSHVPGDTSVGTAV